MTEQRVSPLQGGAVDITVVKASENDGWPPRTLCSCDKRLTGEIAAVRPTCPVHGHGRPAGTGK